jgi:hypothetical protein
MRLNKLLFIFYRLIERFTSIRLESFILYGLFYFYYIVFFRNLVIPIRARDIDKRELWEKFRFNNISNIKEFEDIIKNSLLQGPINFENTMEISIRGHNILQGELISYSKVKVFLHLTFISNLLCPDLYIKREGLRLSDRSNNHQFYVLFYNFKFLKEFYAIDSSRKLLNFVEVRLKNGIVNEGSTFYHLGVVGCVKDLICNNLIPLKMLKNYPKLNECIENFDSQYNLLSSINFGDRDGTFLVQHKQSDNFKLSDKASLLESVQIYALSDDSMLFINKIKDDEFGTGGHFHDDYGHFVLQKNSKTLVFDLGTYKYKLEPKHCKREYHNLPFFTDTPGVEYKSRFVRFKRHETFHKSSKYFIMFANVYGQKSIRRYFLFKTKRIIDIAVGSGNVENLFALDFESFKNGINSQSVLQFQFSNLLSEQLNGDFYYPDYSIKEKCMHYKLKWSLSERKTVNRLMRLKINV